MLKIALALTVITGITLYVVWRGLGKAFKLRPGPLVPLLTAMTLAVEFLGPFGERLIFPALKHDFGLDLPYAAMDWLSYSVMGLVSCLFVCFLAAEVFISLPPVEKKIDLQRRTFLTFGLVSVGATAVGEGQARAEPTVRRIDIPLKSLPAALNGFTIAQISDLHVGLMIDRAYVENVVAITNGLAPDLIALTGDFVDGSVPDLTDAVAPLAALKSIHGSYYIPGNHEYYWGAAPWFDEFKRLGCTVLLNQHVVIGDGDSAFILAGIPDLSAQRRDDAVKPDLEQTLKGAPPDLVKILLAHQPASYELASAAGFDLQLSGHTHAGQYFPFTLLIGLFQRYYKGLNRHENLWVYVNRGTGYWGPPLRTANPTEITLITLRPWTSAT